MICNLDLYKQQGQLQASCRNSWKQDVYSGALNINSSPPSVANLCQWTMSTLVQVMACRLVGAKPLPEPLPTYCQLDPWEHTSVKFESKHFHSRNVFENVLCEMAARQYHRDITNGVSNYPQRICCNFVEKCVKLNHKNLQSSSLLALCKRKQLLTGWFPSQRTRNAMKFSRVGSLNGQQLWI